MVQSIADATRLQQLATGLRESVQKVVVGKSDVIDLAIIALICKGHVLVEDVPGIGKTTMSKALAQSLGCTFNRIQFTPDLMPTDVIGVNFYNQKSGDFQFRSWPNLQPGPAGRRDQQGHSENAVRPSRGDAGAAGHR